MTASLDAYRYTRIWKMRQEVIEEGWRHEHTSIARHLPARHVGRAKCIALKPCQCPSHVAYDIDDGKHNVTGAIAAHDQ